MTNKIISIFSLIVITTLCCIISTTYGQRCDFALDREDTICNPNNGFTVEYASDFGAPRFVFFTSLENGDQTEKFYLELDKFEEYEQTSDEEPQAYEENGDTDIEFKKSDASLNFSNHTKTVVPGVSETLGLIVNTNFTQRKEFDQNFFDTFTLEVTIFYELPEVAPENNVLADMHMVIGNYTWASFGSDDTLRIRLYLDNQSEDEELDRSEDFLRITAQHSALFTDWKALFRDLTPPEDERTDAELDVDVWAGPSHQGRSIFVHLHQTGQETNQDLTFDARFGFGASSTLTASITMMLMMVMFCFFLF
eukprot:CAMPEP_0201547376 /NCGR_PEP_ID=MMETSP0173_2-20130828/3853_1 /ASSEMBLY_ACC=CAM_ASM_000268 /TAXON_ID=218659 /ORGANISM="Vexillifera sp., Strain DIVA3 564/2" /LENGTH=308 /DNA_ID=CAMNT_0047956405 /DNA_START=32 /DNA_END=958 /DNA_ORIENTATION=-